MKFVSAGYLSRTHGIKGELILKAGDFFNPKAKVLYIRKRGSEIPYFIEVIQSFKDGYRVKLKNVNDLNASELLKHTEVFIEESHAKKNKRFMYTEYKIFDESGNEIGTVTALEGSDNNPLLAVKNGDKEFLLPFHSDLILRTDKIKKEIHFRVPDGLLDL